MLLYFSNLISLFHNFYSSIVTSDFCCNPNKTDKVNQSSCRITWSGWFFSIIWTEEKNWNTINNYFRTGCLDFDWNKENKKKSWKRVTIIFVTWANNCKFSSPQIISTFCRKLSCGPFDSQQQILISPVAFISCQKMVKNFDLKLFFYFWLENNACLVAHCQFFHLF